MAALLLVIVVALGSLVWFWRQTTRPGEVHYLKGLELMAANRPQDAENEWLAGLRDDPKSWECYEQLGDLYMTIKHAPEAAACFSAATKLLPDEGRLWAKLARAARAAGRPRDALEPARRAARLLPDDADAVGAWGILEAENKNRGAAVEALRRAHQLKPADRTYHIALVKAELDNLQLAAAEADLMPYVAAHPEDGEAAYLAAVVYNQKPRTPENRRAALEHARRALPSMRADPRIYVLLGQLYLETNQTHEALHLYLQGFQRAPTSDGILHGLVDCYTRLGDKAQADKAAAQLQVALTRRDRIEHLKHVMGFDHKDTAAGLELARLEEESGNISMAANYYRQLVRQAPADPRTREALSGFYLRTGREDLAQKVRNPAWKP